MTKEEKREYDKNYAIKNKEKIKEQQREYYIKNKEKINKRNKEYKIKNKEKMKEQSQKYHKINKIKINLNKKQYRIKNKEKIKERNKEYKIKNKEEIKKRNKEYRVKNIVKIKKQVRSKNGIIKRIYLDQIQSSKRRNHQPPLYTNEELKKWMFDQPNFEDLYNNWVDSGYEKMLKPSVDRLDDYKGYNFDNIQLMTWEENEKKGYEDRKNGINNKQSKAVLQFTKDGEFVKEWYSMRKAERRGFCSGKISSCCRGKQKTHKGFIWKYKGEVN